MKDDHDAAIKLSDLLPPVEAAKFLRAELGYGLTEAMRLINRRRGIEIGERKA